MKELCIHCGRPTPYEINTPVEIDYSGAAERPLNLLRTRCSTGGRFSKCLYEHYSL